MAQDRQPANGGLHKKPEVESIVSLLAHPLLQDPKFLAAVFAVLGAVLFFWFVVPSKKVSRRSGPATVLLVGPSDAGKTSLFAKLVQDTYPQTHTSVLSSVTTFPLSAPGSSGTKPVRLVDLPGHPRLRDEIKKHLSDASAVVFVVDIVGLVRNADTIAELLPPLLTSLASNSMRNPSLPPQKVLFLAHKSDLLIRPAPPASPCPPDLPDATRSTAVERIKSILTREMDRLKSARGATGGKIEGIGRVTGGSAGGIFSRLFGARAVVADEGEGEEDEGLVWGGRGGFKWEDVEGVEVEWGSSALGMVRVGKGANSAVDEEEGNGLDDLRNFLWDA